MSGDVYHPASDDSIRQRPAGADKGASGWPTWRSLRLAQYQAWYLADFDSQDGTIFDGRVDVSIRLSYPLLLVLGVGPTAFGYR